MGFFPVSMDNVFGIQGHCILLCMPGGVVQIAPDVTGAPELLGWGRKTISVYTQRFLTS